MQFGDIELDIILDVVGAPGTLADGSTVRGRFVRPGTNLQVLDGQVDSQDPRFLIKISDQLANGIEIGTQITIKGVTYTVSDTDERNDGFVSLPLTEV